MPDTAVREVPGGAVREVRARSQTELVVRRFLRHRLAVAALVVFVLIVVFAFAGEHLWRYHHDSITPDSSRPPSWRHPFGTDSIGHDTLAQVMRGTQQSVKIALTVALVATGFGTIWGAVAGYYRGWADALMMRMVDVVITLPTIAVAAALSGMWAGGGGWWGIALVLAGLSWTTVARVVRGVVLSLREQEFIEAARAIGASDSRIILRHLIPNALGPVIVAATIIVAVAILAETALSFVGFGVRPPDTSLGLLISSAKDASTTRPWLFYFPGVFIVLIALTVNFIGDGLRDAFDPRQSTVRR
jgi:peptide/nickel transport system permease protein